MHISSHISCCFVAICCFNLFLHCNCHTRPSNLAEAHIHSITRFDSCRQLESSSNPYALSRSICSTIAFSAVPCGAPKGLYVHSLYETPIQIEECDLSSVYFCPRVDQSDQTWHLTSRIFLMTCVCDSLKFHISCAIVCSTLKVLTENSRHISAATSKTATAKSSENLHALYQAII